MSNKLGDKTNPEVLISFLREEIGQIIDSWILYRHFKLSAQELQTPDLLADMQNPNLNFLYLITDKFKEDIIARISELSTNSIGQLTFYFAAVKLKVLEKETQDFHNFVKQNKFIENRNNFISHKNLKPNWELNKAPHKISYPVIVRAIAMALRLMKQFDEVYHGKQIKKQWILSRRKRYDFRNSRKGSYMLLPYLAEKN